MADPFYDVRNALTVGNYHQAVAEASGVRTTLRKAEDIAEFNAERDALLALAQIGLGQFETVIAQLASATHPTLRAVRAWAEFCAALANSGNLNKNANNAKLYETNPALQAPLQKLTEAAENVDPARVTEAVLAACALLASGDPTAALKLAKGWLSELPTPQGPAAMRQHMELRVIVVESLLRLRRPELARAEVKSMEQLDDESVLTVLYSGIVSLYEGVKTRDAYDTALQRFKEISMRCGQSVLAHNLMALAHMGLGDFASAERSLLDALAMKSADVDTTANLAVVSAHLGKAADPTNRYIQQAAAVAGTWSQSFNAMSARLDEAILQFSTAA
ncbi:coatomer epsilon subunit [Trypanosoma theileri]|uniref:Coatomer epsilon subunit n=1 Tax=Trypanosoma theileri TaxID=67003 RepID=A0A1X0NVS2_9TRYP|nr:coatomer epsilon subunit [Trypanosoma theileri]ORC88309.1 coatomer epsilon subunit [Trypanosoma theileri]